MTTVAGDEVVAERADRGQNRRHLCVAVELVNGGATRPGTYLLEATSYDPGVVACDRIVVARGVAGGVTVNGVGTVEQVGAQVEAAVVDDAVFSGTAAENVVLVLTGIGGTGCVAEDQVVAVVTFDGVVAEATGDHVSLPTDGAFVGATREAVEVPSGRRADEVVVAAVRRVGLNGQVLVAVALPEDTVAAVVTVEGVTTTGQRADRRAG